MHLSYWDYVHSSCYNGHLTGVLKRQNRKLTTTSFYQGWKLADAAKGQESYLEWFYAADFALLANSIYITRRAGKYVSFRGPL